MSVCYCSLTLIHTLDRFAHTDTQNIKIYYKNLRNNKVASVEKLFVNGASNLNYGGYGEAQEFKPSSKQSPVIYLSGTKKEFNAKL